MFVKIVVFVILVYLALVDIKRQKICFLVPVSGSVLAVGIHYILEGKFLIFFLSCIGFFLFFVIVSMITKGQFGSGDAFAFGMTGAAVGFWQNLYLVYFSFVFAFFAAVFFLLRKKGKRYSMPFLPFLCMAYLLLLCV